MHAILTLYLTFNKAFRTTTPLSPKTIKLIAHSWVNRLKTVRVSHWRWLTHYMADLLAMHRGPRSIPLCIQHHIQLTSLSFQVSRPSHSWDTAISISYLENPKSRSWVRSKLKVTTWVHYFIDSHHFRSITIGHTIPEIRLVQNLTLEIQGQGHEWGERWKSQHGSNISLSLWYKPHQILIRNT